MNAMTHDNDEISKLFQENDALGSESSVWLRPLRQLFEEGKPIGQIIALTVSVSEKQKMPFGMLSWTENSRLIFWPILPKGISIYSGTAIDVLDHITLEYPSEKIHVTGYDSNGKAIHETQGWKLYHLTDCELAVWFTLIIRTSILRDQDAALQRKVRMPASDKERRVNEFLNYTKNMKIANVSLPPQGIEGGYIYCSLSIGSNCITTNQLPASVLPAGPHIDSQVDGWSEGTEYLIMPSRLTIDTRTVYISTACPPGKVLTDVSVGFLRKISR